MTPTPIIFHHFDASPFSEKIRLVFGLKQLAWRSVRVSPIMPRPDLTPMTGGYRRTPTMQIGADIFCDTRIILREIEARYPEPMLLPRGVAGMATALGMWTDRAFFRNTVNLVFGTLGDQVPREFIEDRERLRGGKFDISGMKAALPQMRDQFRAHVDWIETQLASAGGEWLLGAVSLADVHTYMNVWYVTTRLPHGEALLQEFPRVRAWAARARKTSGTARARRSGPTRRWRSRCSRVPPHPSLPTPATPMASSPATASP
jgi:glutathione S-transferase